MSTKHSLLLFLFTMLLFACKDEAGNNSETQHAITIYLQPFKDIPQSQVNFVYKELLALYPNVIINKAISLTASAFYAPRNRYRADSLIKYLLPLTPNHAVTIGLTGKDISTTKGKVQDYGVMGLGYQPGRSCVISTFRLNKEEMLPQFFKVAIHELGHTQGLSHCPVKTCFMRDAEGKNHTNEETDFCPKCKAHLVSKGWTFKNKV